MIDWSVSPVFVRAKTNRWFFPSFEIQGFLLPLINIGEPIIDESGDTTFTSEDCRRLIGNIDFVLGSGTFENRMCVRFDSLERGLIDLPCDEIKQCLRRLREAADEAVRRGGSLTFFGD